MWTNNICLFNKWVFHHKLFSKKLSTTFIYSKKWACRNDNFSCSLLCTWMTIIDCLFYSSGSLSWDFSWEYIAKLLVAWLYYCMKLRPYPLNSPVSNAWPPIQLLHCLYQLGLNFLFPHLELGQCYLMRHSFNFLTLTWVLRGFSTWEFKMFCSEERWH